MFMPNLGLSVYSSFKIDEMIDFTNCSRAKFGALTVNVCILFGQIFRLTVSIFIHLNLPINPRTGLKGVNKPLKMKTREICQNTRKVSVPVPHLQDLEMSNWPLKIDKLRKRQFHIF